MTVAAQNKSDLKKKKHISVRGGDDDREDEVTAAPD